MGIPEQLKAAMEQEQSSEFWRTGPVASVRTGFSGGVRCVPLPAGKEAAPEVEMSIPGLDWGMDEVMGRDSKKVPQKKVPYAKPIPAQFQQVPLHTWPGGDDVM